MNNNDLNPHGNFILETIIISFFWWENQGLESLNSQANVK